MTEDVKTRIDEKVKSNKVVLYMKGTPDFPQCGFSAHTVEILRSYGVPFASEDVLADRQRLPVRMTKGAFDLPLIPDQTPGNFLTQWTMLTDPGHSR